jgi:hypothetical protein
MPQISRFFGIIISMFFDEHNPPHFNATYGEYNAAIGIADYKILSGYLPPRTLGLVIEWAALHQSELIENWENIEKGKTPMKIKPLE